jgi:hypothetical protein
MVSLLATLRERMHRSSTLGASFGTLPWDGVPWEFPQPERVVAVGDVQGDPEALDAVLRAASLVDDDGHWCGTNHHLVLLGDLVGGHADSRLLVPFVMRLEREAQRAGGRVHTLLGNHDVLPARGDVAKWTRREKRRYQQLPVAGAQSARACDAFSGDSELARWLRGRNAVLRLGDTLFAHAGLGEWFPATTPGDVNATVRAWVAHWQGRRKAPPSDTRWAAGVPGMARMSRFACGPLWTRVFKPDGDKRPEGAPRRADLARWLEDAGVKRLVVGHSPVPDGDILLEHPYFGDLVVMVDTSLSDRRNGRLRGLDITAEGLAVVRGKQRDRDPACCRRELQALEQPSAAPWWQRLWRRVCRLFTFWRRAGR